MSKKSNRINVPEARAAMDKFKMEAANEVGVNLKNGYNGDLSSREAGSIGGKDGMLDPAGNATRAEVATMLMRFVALL